MEEKFNLILVQTFLIGFLIIFILVCIIVKAIEMEKVQDVLKSL